MTLIADTHPEDASSKAAPSAETDGAAAEQAGAAEGAASPAQAMDAAGVAGMQAASPEDGKARKHETGGAVIAIPPALEADLRAERTGGNGPEARPRGLGARLLDYSAHAAMIVGLIGFAWTVSNHVVSPPAATEAAAPALATPTEVAIKAAPTRTAVASDPAAAALVDLRRSNERLAADLGGLRAQIDALASSNSRVPGQVKALQIALDSVQSGLAAVRSESATSTAQLRARLDKMALERDAALARPERGGTDATTGSLPAAKAEASPQVAGAMPLPPVRSEVAKPEVARAEAYKSDASRIETAKSASAPSKPDDPRRAADADKPPIIATYVVRDVARGVALIEGRRGMLEVVPGVSIPGAGVVKSIERRGRGWTVITTKGQLAYAAPLPTDRRDGGRDYYPSYRYDF